MTEERTKNDDLALFITAAEAHLDDMRDLIETSRVIIRSSDHRDIIFGAHLSRMTLTCQSVFRLCRMGSAHDATVLCRVLLEHNISLIYLVTQKDAVKATRDFVMDSLTHVGNSHLNAAKHYPESFQFDPDKARQAIEIGENARYQNGVMAQLEYLRSNFPQTYFDWYKDLIYGDLSICTHPHASGMDPFAPAFAEAFQLRRPSLPEQNTSAAALSWAFTQSAYAWTAFAWGLTWGKDLVDSGVALLIQHPNVRSAVGVGMYLPDLPSAAPMPPGKKSKPGQRTRKK
jgi:hypothetical protein